MAIANAKYEFIFSDFQTILNGGVIELTKFYEKCLQEWICLLPPRKATNSTEDLPYVFTGDEMFLLCWDFLKPFTQRELNQECKIFNYTYQECKE
jgi:hypothetical protein